MLILELQLNHFLMLLLELQLNHLMLKLKLQLNQETRAGLSDKPHLKDIVTYYFNKAAPLCEEQCVQNMRVGSYEKTMQMIRFLCC